MTDVRPITTCRLCGGVELREIVDFGSVPLGNNLQETVASALAAAQYPLNVRQCAACGHFQLGVAVDPKILYATNYTYLSGIGASFLKHFDSYADWIKQKTGAPAGALAVDVGSNDGSCLKALAARGFAVCGVDPASVPARIANENGIDTINAFFDEKAVAAIKRKHGPADLVTSHNVLAHVDDLAATFRNIYDLLKPGGTFCFEIGYFREVLRNDFFDTIYHEHLDYHHAAPLARHLTALGFGIEDFSVNASQGGSLRTLARKTGRGAISAEAERFLAEERNSIVNDETFLKGWRGEIGRKMDHFAIMVRERRAKGVKVAAYGAPTKATLLSKIAGLGRGDIDYVVEDNALKTGRFLPATAIPILPTEHLREDSPGALVIFAWNFASDIVSKLKGSFDRPVEAIVPLPEPRIIKL